MKGLTAPASAALLLLANYLAAPLKQAGVLPVDTARDQVSTPSTVPALAAAQASSIQIDRMIEAQKLKRV
jgi:hypothetical protein